MQGELTQSCEAAARELDGQFGANRSDLTAQTREHLTSCASCRALYAFADVDTANPSTDADLQRAAHRVAGLMTADLKPVKPLPSMMISVVEFLGLFAVLLAGLIGIWAVQGVVSLPTWRVAAMLGIVVIGAVVVSFTLARKMRPGSVKRVSDRFVMLTLGALLVAGFLALFPWAGINWTQGNQGRGFAVEGWSCFWPGIAMAVPVAGALWIVARRGARQSLTGLGAALGAMGGLFGMAALELSCSNLEAAHLIFSHAGVLVASAAAGALTGYLMTHMSRRPV